MSGWGSRNSPVGIPFFMMSCSSLPSLRDATAMDAKPGRGQGGDKASAAELFT